MDNVLFLAHETCNFSELVCYLLSSSGFEMNCTLVTDCSFLMVYESNCQKELEKGKH